eukprot:scaffold13061_cov29-Prasinocladus_malaysianus.AAC.1
MPAKPCAFLYRLWQITPVNSSDAIFSLLYGWYFIYKGQEVNTLVSLNLIVVKLVDRACIHPSPTARAQPHSKGLAGGEQSTSTSTQYSRTVVTFSLLVPFAITSSDYSYGSATRAY